MRQRGESWSQGVAYPYVSQSGQDYPQALPSRQMPSSEAPAFPRSPVRGPGEKQLEYILLNSFTAAYFLIITKDYNFLRENFNRIEVNFKFSEKLDVNLTNNNNTVKLYNQFCASCHENGRYNAPARGNVQLELCSYTMHARH